MAHHNVLVPLRFLAMLGHFLAAFLALFAIVSRTLRTPTRTHASHTAHVLAHTHAVLLALAHTHTQSYAQHDSVIVALRFSYVQSEYNSAHDSCAPRPTPHLSCPCAHT